VQRSTESSPIFRVVAAEVEQNGRFLLTQRRPGAVFGLCWEFPGGRVETGESDQEALARELQERLGVRAHIGERVLELRQEYEGWSIDFVVHRAALEGEPRPQRVQDLAWVHPDDFEKLRFPDADQQSVARLLGLPLVGS
jgi:8-oxo-dGTP diphosphatase